MPIPPGTRFHGVAPSVDVQDRGSASRNALRDTYPIEDFGADGTKFKAVLGQTLAFGGSTVRITGVDPATGYPIVYAATHDRWFSGIVDAVQGGEEVTLSAGLVVDVTICGVVESFRYYGDDFANVSIGDIIYFNDALSVGNDDERNTFPLGRFLSVPADSYAPVKILAFPPQAHDYYNDDAQISDSFRSQAGIYSGTVTPGDIVKIVTNPGSSNTPRIFRWDPTSGDTVADIAGLCSNRIEKTAGVDGAKTAIAYAGTVNLLSANVGGSPTPAAKVYSDSVTPYRITTDPTSGIQVGIITRKIPVAQYGDWEVLIKL